MHISPHMDANWPLIKAKSWDCQAFKPTDDNRIWTAVHYGNWLLPPFHHGQSKQNREQWGRDSVSARKVKAEGNPEWGREHHGKRKFKKRNNSLST